MNTIERITITLTPEMAPAVRGAVEAGEYASSSEIIREALRDRRHKRALQEQELADLRARIQGGTRRYRSRSGPRFRPRAYHP